MRAATTVFIGSIGASLIYRIVWNGIFCKYFFAVVVSKGVYELISQCKLHEAMRDMLVDERNLPLNVIRNLKLVNDAVVKIAKEEEIELDAVSALMVYEELSEKSIS